MSQAYRELGGNDGASAPQPRKLLRGKVQNRHTGQHELITIRVAAGSGEKLGLYGFLRYRSDEGDIVPVRAEIWKQWTHNRWSIIAKSSDGRIIGHTATYIFDEQNGAELRSQVVLEPYQGQHVYSALTIVSLEQLRRMSESSGQQIYVFAHKVPGSGGSNLLKELGFRSITDQIFKQDGGATGALSPHPTDAMMALPSRMRRDALKRGPGWELLVRNASRLSQADLVWMLQQKGWSPMKNSGMEDGGYSEAKHLSTSYDSLVSGTDEGMPSRTERAKRLSESLMEQSE